MNELIVPRNFEKYDVTLRDGAQDPRARLSVEKKLKLALLLEDFGFDYIEGGWPGANKMDTLFFEKAKGFLKRSRLVAFGMTIKDNKADKDEGLKKLLNADTDIVTIVGKSWEQNVKSTLRISGEENLNNILETVNFLRGKGKEVFFDAEHWFDSCFQDKDYAYKSLKAALHGGASRLVLCDTRGAVTDTFIKEATEEVIAKFPNTKFGIHVHQDSELAVINTIRALEAGAVHVQGTVNGVGERAGNANWCSLLPTLQFKYADEIGVDCGLDLRGLTPFTHQVAMLTGISVSLNAPYVGYYAFAHKGGLHASGQERDPEAYEHIRPEWVGNKRVYVFSEQGGSAHLEFMLKNHHYTLSRKEPKFKILLEKMKGYSYFGEAQEKIFLYENLENGIRPFDVLDGTGVEDKSPYPPKAFVNVRVNGDKYHEEAVGDGPINAFDIALKKVLSGKYPEVNEIELYPSGYRVTTSNGDTTTASEVEVCITALFRGKKVNSIVRGTSQNRAGEAALADLYNCCILENSRKLEQV